MFSTLSITVEKHYCGDHLVDIAVFTEAKTCGMEVPNDLEGFAKKSCCKDIIDLIEGQDELSLTDYEGFKLTNSLILSLGVLPLDIHEVVITKGIYSQIEYSPPLITKDFYILHEVFLI